MFLKLSAHSSQKKLIPFFKIFVIIKKHALGLHFVAKTKIGKSFNP
jgi:hypothetical protein